MAIEDDTSYERLLCDNLGRWFNDIREELRPISGLSRDKFDGAVIEFLLKTAVKLAIAHGMPVPMIHSVIKRIAALNGN